MKLQNGNIASHGPEGGEIGLVYCLCFNLRYRQADYAELLLGICNNGWAP